MTTKVEAWKNRTKSEQEIIISLYKAKEKMHHKNAYVTTTEEMSLTDWDGNHPYEEHTKVYNVPAGTTLKVVMVSRLGDMGLTDKLNVQYGYKTRVDLDSTAIKDLRWQP